MSTSMSELEHRASEFARQKHGEIDHRRKYNNLPYIVHPAEVVDILKTVPHTQEMLAAGWLHDTVEDTNTTLDEIEREFGAVVATLVEQLTDVSKPEDGNRKLRKALDLDHTSTASPNAKTIKLADLLSNSKSIVKEDANFARTYLREKSDLLLVLRAGDTTLWHQAAQIVLNNLDEDDAKRQQLLW